MIRKVDIIRRNPLFAIKLGDEQYREKFEEDPLALRAQISRVRESFMKSVRNSHLLGTDSKPLWQRQKPAKPVKIADKKKTLETQILENTIIKLGSLLALGFGEAGSEIIGQNLEDDDGNVDAMIPGSKLDAIF